MTPALLLGLLASFEHDGCEPSLVATLADELRVEALEPAPGELHLRCGAKEVEVHVRVEHGDEVIRTLTLGDDARREVRLAVQVADLYRAQVAEARFRRSVVTPAAEQPTAPLPTPWSPQPATWHATLGVGLMGAPGGFHLEPAVSGQVVRQVPGVELGVKVQATVRATTLRTAQWSSSTGLAQASGVVERPFDVGAWVLEPRLTLGALLVWAEGQASSGFVAATGVTATFLGSLGGSVWRRLTPQVAVGLEGDVAVAPIAVRVEVPGSTTAVGLVFSAAAAVRFQ
jgi:hypothetical protein